MSKTLEDRIVGINDKTISLVTGLVLLMGVGLFVHKGEELFAPSVKEQVAEASIDAPTIEEIEQVTSQIENADTQRPETPKTVDVQKIEIQKSDTDIIVLVSNDQDVAKQDDQKTIGTIKFDSVYTNCDVSLNTISLNGARIRLEIIAPCHKNKVVFITHAGLRFSEIISNLGSIVVTIPVLSDPANIEVSFADGVTKFISTPVKDLSSQLRTGIAWSGQVDLELHASESTQNSSKHTSNSAPINSSYKQAYLQGGGYFTTLGNKNISGGSIVKIYSVENPDDMFVDFQVVLNNPLRKCGHVLSMKTIRYAIDLGTQISDKNFLIRDCANKSGNMVLKNMLRGMIVAQRN